MRRCLVHCPPESSGIAAKAGAVLAAVAVAAAAIAVAGSLAVALIAAELAAAAVIGLALRLRLQATARPAARPAPPTAPDPRQPLAIEAPRLAIEAAKPAGTWVTLDAADYARVDHQDQATGNANRTQQNKPRSMRNGPV